MAAFLMAETGERRLPCGRSLPRSGTAATSGLFCNGRSLQSTDMTIHEPLLSPTGAPIPAMDPKAEPTLKSPEAGGFYVEPLRERGPVGFPFLLPGPYPVGAYTGITRPTKDLDIFC